MTDYEKKLDEIKENLEANKNVILTGAPGTGKTFMAKTVAARIILEREINDFDKDLTEEEKKQVESQTDFVQFHPSYDYTDFVEGLRPIDKDGNGNVGFERRDGVFKKFCEKAILPSSVTEDIQKELNENPTIWKVSLERTGDNPTRTDCLKNGYIRLGWSNYGDVADFSNFSGYTEVGGSVVLVAFQSKMKIGDIVLSCYSATEIDAVGIVTGDYEYRPEGGDYPRYRTVKWIVKGIKENIVEKNHGKTLTSASVYKLSVSIKDVFDIVEKYSTNQTLSSDSQEKTSNNPYVFIIDEINRGEVAKIFGELFYCVDPGYRGKEGKINTQYQNLIKENNIFYSGFFIPENVYIIGTMNDIDRSVESMDFAFRRRFSWIEVKSIDTVGMLDPKYDDNGELIAGLEKNLTEEAKRRMKNLNAAISKIDGLNDAYHIGASYFLKLKNYGGDFGKLWDYHIKGILQEYLRGNPNGKLEDLKAAYDREKEKKDGE
jgi:5-methylcytosine-specific restriction protein B